MAVMLRALVCLFFIFFIKKPSNVGSNSNCYMFKGEYVKDIREMFVCSSLWQYQLDFGLKIRPKVALQILLLLSGDIELCPGHSLNCPTCVKGIRRNQQRAKCEVCQNVFHMKCLLDKLERNRELLVCSICNVKEIHHCTQGNQDQNPQILEKLKKYLGQRGLKILHQNVNGLLSKLNHIKVLLHDSGKNIHALGITESKLNS